MDLLKVSVVFGANASGKSNFVKALNFFKHTVISGEIPIGTTTKYCRQDKKNENTPSYFEMEVCFDDTYYTYGFEVLLSQRQLVSEWFVEERPSGKDIILFERDITKGTYTLSPDYQPKASVYLEDIKSDPSSLFLKVMNQNKPLFYKENPSYQIFHDMYLWIASSLDINYPDRPINQQDFFKSEDIKKVCALLETFATGISNYQICEIPTEKVMALFPKDMQEFLGKTLEKEFVDVKSSQHKGENDTNTIFVRGDRDFYLFSFEENRNEIVCKTIQFCHGGKTSWYDFGEESDGTIRLFDLLKILLTKQDNKVFIVDELDRCLHPNLTYRYIQEYIQSTMKKRNIQLIVTSHESRLMDFNLLRRDEMWITDRRPDGTTDLYSLEEYNIRNDLKVDKAYLEGRYGGVPLFTTLFPLDG
ncbi:MAG: ATP/GTP-binding protein [Sphaerochaetaceae bacterium]